MAQHYKPLTLERLEYGRFVPAVESALAAVQRQLLDHIRTYGDEAKDAKAKLKLEVEFRVTEPYEGAVSVVTKIQSVTPARPKGGTMALADLAQKKAKTLFVFDPETGEQVDPETGEVLSGQKKGK